ncbi:MAG TPA: GNAT family N-acetyltransferase, partial [Armatimonadetes bacterium]|nr:GNAT family N-acetyltransferase [Armatimonadota bacterium]
IDRWNACIRQWLPPNRAFFLLHQWLCTWWERLGRWHLLVLCADVNGRVIALAPLCIQWLHHIGARVIRFLGTGVSDYGDIALMPHCEVMGGNALLNWLVTHRCAWDVIDLREVSIESPALNAIINWWSQHGARAGIMLHITRSEPCLVLNLPASYGDLLHGIGRNLRYNLRRRERQLRKRFNIDIGVVHHDAERHEVLEHMFWLHTRRWRAKWQPGVFAWRTVRDFHRHFTSIALRHGWLALHYMKLNGRYVAVHYCFQLDSAVCYYGGGFDTNVSKYSVGTVLMGKAIQHAIEHGASVFDFLRGDEPYKLSWGAHPVPNLHVRLYQPRSLRSRIAFAWLRLQDRVTERVKQWAHGK